MLFTHWSRVTAGWSLAGSRASESPWEKGTCPLPLRSHPLPSVRLEERGAGHSVDQPLGCLGPGQRVLSLEKVWPSAHRAGVHRNSGVRGDRPEKGSKMEQTSPGRVNGWRSPRVTDLEALGPPDGEGWLPSCLQQGPITDTAKAAAGPCTGPSRTGIPG